VGCSEACNSVVMTLGLTHTLFILLSVELLLMAANVEEDIKIEIIKHLGMKKTPDTKHANVSSAEYHKMMTVYRQSVRQTEALRQLRDHFDSHIEQSERFNDIVIYSDSTHSRWKRSSGNVSSDSKLEMFHFNSSVFPRQTFVSSATISVQLAAAENDCKVTAVQAVDGSDGIIVDTVTSISDEIVTMDITHAVQAWVLDEESNKGLILISEGCEVALPRGNRNSAEIHLKVEQIKSRPKRSLKRTKKTSKKCRKKAMKVRFEDLEGFDFIYMPQEFDASFCKGKCPPRYQPMTDHSLLQSLMFIKSEKDARKTGKRSKIKKPCCSPSKFESLDILHLDETDPTRLKVTNWKNIKVSQCACA